MNSINIELVNKRLVEVLYFSEVLIPHLQATISEAQKEFNILIELFHEQFYFEIYRKLQKKKEVFKIYLEDLLEMKSEFDNYVQVNEKLQLDVVEIEYEDILIHCTAEVSVLIQKLEIEMKEIIEKKDKNYEKFTKDNKNTNCTTNDYEY